MDLSGQRTEFTEMTIPTEFGEVSVETLLKYYATAKRGDKKRKEWLKTDEGKEWNREKAKKFYEENRNRVLDKRKEQYAQNREKILDRAKKYYADHAEEIQAKQKAKRELMNELYH